MKLHPDIPSLDQLALQYGTINKKQQERAQELFHRLDKESRSITMAQILLEQNLATRSQISLLELIQEFLVVKKEGEQFGQIAIDKGFATKKQIDQALKRQREEFKRAKLRRMIGDILVESGVITLEQRDEISKEQQRLDRESRTEVLLSEPDPQDEDRLPETASEIQLSDFEKEFLRIQALDKAFAGKVIEKGYADKFLVQNAMKKQEQEFRANGQISLLGEILVEEGVLSDEQRDMILAEQKRLSDYSTAPNTHSEFNTESPFSISVSDDRLEAWIQVFENMNNEISSFMVEEALKAKGIIHGVLSSALIQSQIDAGNTTFLAARGTLPISAEDIIPDFYFKPAKSRSSSMVSSEHKVEKGEALAELKPARTPIPGKDLFGKQIHADNPGKNMDKIFRLGKGTRLSRDRFKAFAGRSGIPYLGINNRIYVFSTVSLLEDADFRTGPIENFANVSIAGMLTGAYPVKAGRVKAREIRDADLEVIENTFTAIGITNSTIRSQGNIYARYIHNSTIEAFGDVIVDYEILDSTIIVSGAVKAEKSRIIASTISAKKGVSAAGIGSDVTEPCHVSAGREDHLIKEMARLDNLSLRIQSPLDELIKKHESMAEKEKLLFNKMARLKLLHDRAKIKKETIQKEIEAKTINPNSPETEKTKRLLADVNKKMKSAIKLIRDLYENKKVIGIEQTRTREKIERLRPRIENKIKEIEKDKTLFIEWSQAHPGQGQIRVSGPVAQDTLLRGIHASLTTTRDLRHVRIFETAAKTGSMITEMVVESLEG